MNNSSSQAVCRIKKFLCDLFKVQLRSDYDVKLSLYKDDESEQPSYTHSSKGTSRCEIMKIIAVLSFVMLIASVVSAFTCCNCKRK